MKSKKFDAHKKHFKEKEIKLNRQINHLYERCTQVNEENIKLKKENEHLIKENTELSAKYEKLLEYSKLSDEEIKQAIKKDISINQFSSIINVMTNFM